MNVRKVVPYIQIKEEEKIMKKIAVIVAILVAFSLVGCASSGGGGKSSAGGGATYSVDLSKVTIYSVQNSPDRLGTPLGPNVLKNITPITRNWEDVMFMLPEDMPDLTGFQRVTVTLKYYNKDGDELAPRDSFAMASMLYDTAGDWRGPEMGAGPNAAFKEFNVGGFSGMISQERGVRVALKSNPKALLAQAAQDRNVAFIELTGIHFHNGNFKF